MKPRSAQLVLMLTAGVGAAVVAVVAIEVVDSGRLGVWLVPLISGFLALVASAMSLWWQEVTGSRVQVSAVEGAGLYEDAVSAASLVTDYDEMIDEILRNRRLELDPDVEPLEGGKRATRRTGLSKAEVARLQHLHRRRQEALTFLDRSRLELYERGRVVELHRLEDHIRSTFGPFLRAELHRFADPLDEWVPKDDVNWDPRT